MPIPEDVYTLLSKHLAQQPMDADEQARLHRWQKVNPETFEELSQVYWEQRSGKSTFRRAEAQQKINQRIDALEAENEPFSQRRLFLRYKIAASISLILLFAGFAYYLAPWNLPSEVKQGAWVEKSTQNSQVATFTLTDGSRVTLNANSKIRYAALRNAPTREVYLDGEAFFEVTPDPERPFVIRTEALTTRVLGTSFSVSAYPKDDLAKVTVATGRVAVDLPERPATVLHPNRRLVYNKRNKTRSEHSANLANELAWREGRLVFEGAKLSQVARVLERYYNVTISFENEDPQSCLITATFKQETLFHVLKSISYINDLNYTFNQGVVTITGRGCSP